MPKTRLLQKLSEYAFEGKVLCWIADFLSDRKMGYEANILNGLMLSAGFHKALHWDPSCF